MHLLVLLLTWEYRLNWKLNVTILHSDGKHGDYVIKLQLEKIRQKTYICKPSGNKPWASVSEGITPWGTVKSKITVLLQYTWPEHQYVLLPKQKLEQTCHKLVKLLEWNEFLKKGGMINLLFMHFHDNTGNFSSNHKFYYINNK